MADNESSSEMEQGGNGNGTEQHNPNPNPAGTGAGTSAASAEELQAELERARDALRKANSEAAERRKKLEAYEAAEQKRKSEELSEADRLKLQLSEAQQALDSQRAENRRYKLLGAASREAARLNLDFHPDALDDALRLGDLDGVREDEDTGNLSGMDAVLRELAKRKPYLLRQKGVPNINGGERGKTNTLAINEDELKRQFGIR
jgi:multidrug efflux pump subunit AcrA (membrane-fusion protein)